MAFDIVIIIAQDTTLKSKNIISFFGLFGYACSVSSVLRKYIAFASLKLYYIYCDPVKFEIVPFLDVDW